MRKESVPSSHLPSSAYRRGVSSAAATSLNRRRSCSRPPSVLCSGSGLRSVRVRWADLGHRRSGWARRCPSRTPWQPAHVASVCRAGPRGHRRPPWADRSPIAVNHAMKPFLEDVFAEIVRAAPPVVRMWPSPREERPGDDLIRESSLRLHHARTVRDHVCNEFGLEARLPLRASPTIATVAVGLVTSARRPSPSLERGAVDQVANCLSRRAISSVASLS